MDPLVKLMMDHLILDIDVMDAYLDDMPEQDDLDQLIIEILEFLLD